MQVDEELELAEVGLEELELVELELDESVELPTDCWMHCIVSGLLVVVPQLFKSVQVRVCGKTEQAIGYHAVQLQFGVQVVVFVVVVVVVLAEVHD